MHWDAVRGDPRGVVLDLGDCFLNSLQSTRAHSTFVWSKFIVASKCQRCTSTEGAGCCAIHTKTREEIEIHRKGGMPENDAEVVLPFRRAGEAVRPKPIPAAVGT